MPARMIIELPNNHRVFFGDADAGGLSEVSALASIPKATSAAFQGALGSLAELVKTLEASVGAMEKKPQKIEMSFGAKLSGKCDLWVVSGDGEADFSVTLTWGG